MTREGDILPVEFDARYADGPARRPLPPVYVRGHNVSDVLAASGGVQGRNTEEVYSAQGSGGALLWLAVLAGLFYFSGKGRK